MRYRLLLTSNHRGSLPKKAIYGGISDKETRYGCEVLWYIDIHFLEELQELINEVDEEVIMHTDGKTIEIYNWYRE